MANADGMQCRQLFSKANYPIAPVVKTQTDLIHEGMKDYFPELVDNIKENIAHLTGMSDFDFFQSMHRENPERSVFRLFKKNSVRNRPQPEWSFSFYNNDRSFGDILKMEFGLCSGMTSTLRRLNMLANFEATPGESVPDKKSQKKQWIKYYTSKIDRIVNYRMTTIDGFNNLYEFTSDPDIQKYIRLEVLEKWKENNVNIIQGGIDGFMSVRQEMDTKDLIELNTELSQRLQYGYNPIVYLSKPGELFSKQQWIHVVMVVGVTAPKTDGSYTIEIWDSNYPGNKALRTIQVTATQEIIMDDANLNVIKMLRWDDLEIERMIKANVPGME